MNASLSRGRAALAGIVVLVVLTAACTSGDDGDNAGSGTTEGVDLSLLGPSNPASGDPIKIGFINEGQTAAIDSRDEVKAADAAVSYVNEYLGGVGGRPLELIKCETHLTPAGSTDCANQMVSAGVPVVLQVTPGVPVPILSVLEESAIPYFVFASVEPSMLSSTDAYVLTNTLGGLASPIQVAKDQGVKRVATLLIDVPAAVGPIKGLGQPLFDKAGIAVQYIAIPPGTPDMTPQVQDAIGQGAELFTIIGDPAFCISALGALSTLGFEGTRLVNPQCLSPDVATAVPGGLEGVLVGTTESLDAEDSEVALYEAVLEHYAPGTQPHLSSTSGGFAIVVAFARAMTGIAGAITPESVRATLASMDPQPQPLLAGQTFQCDRALFVLTPSVCSAGLAIVTLDADGQGTSSVPFDTTAILNG